MVSAHVERRLGIPAEHYWRVRNALIHEGQVAPKQLDTDSNFIPHGSQTMRWKCGRSVVTVPVEHFVREMTEAGGQWLADKADEELITELDISVWFAPLK